jgi:hypothetical protein
MVSLRLGSRGWIPFRMHSFLCGGVEGGGSGGGGLTHKLKL